MTTLQLALDKIGNELVNCSDGCAGISMRNMKNGVMPRCLYLESQDTKGRGCIAVGLNPGISNKSERKSYKDHKFSYSSFKMYMKKTIDEIAYHRKIHKLIKCIDLNGPIIWTELAKCEKSKKSGRLPLDTLRHCTNKYLVEELKLVPPNWPIIGIGKEAYIALSYIAPRRTIIGVPHPTGSHGHFPALFEPNNGPMKKRFRRIAIDAMQAKKPEAVWLG